MALECLLTVKLSNGIPMVIKMVGVDEKICINCLNLQKITLVLYEITE